MNWILILVLSGASGVTAEFSSEWACKSAGRTIVDDLGDAARYWCVPSKA